MRGKSILAIALAIVMSFAVAVFPKTTATALDTVEYTFIIRSDKVCGFEGIVTFPSDALKVKSIKVYDGNSGTYYKYGDGSVVFNGSSSTDSFDFSGGTELITIEFSVLKEFDKKSIDTDIHNFYTVAQYSSDENEPFYYTSCINKLVVAGGYVDLDDMLQSYKVPDELLPAWPGGKKNPGDINADGAINQADIDLLIRFLNQWDVTINELNSDVDADGIINMKDIVLLQQYINKWDVVLK